jgi:hypothetical protein
MVRPERFELPASSSGGKRSIQLSYGRAKQVYIESIRAFNCGSGGVEAENSINHQGDEVTRRNRTANSSPDRRHEIAKKAAQFRRFARTNS